MVRSDGTADYRLNENDYTKKEDGTASDVANADYDGGAFAWAQKIYKREYTSGDDRYVLFRFEKADGFEPVGFIDPDNKELEGVWIPMFYGSIISDKMKCISGNQPVYNKNTSQEKAAIDAFGTRAKFFGGAIIETLVDLMLMFGKTAIYRRCTEQEIAADMTRVRSRHTELKEMLLLMADSSMELMIIQALTRYSTQLY